MISPNAIDAYITDLARHAERAASLAKEAWDYADLARQKAQSANRAADATRTLLDELSAAIANARTIENADTIRTNLARAVQLANAAPERN